jgi:tRNA/tmRNA/rRNA uracil-C5-methylase (TrmA/RlmC/RlmD family)
VTRRPPSRRELLELSVERAAPGGDCVGHAPDGRVVFIRGALPGEQVRVAVTVDNRRLMRADTVEVLTASPDRVCPPCPLAVPGRCGGCDWQHASLPAGRAIKGAVLRDQLIRLGGTDPGPLTVQAPPSSPDGLGWRTRVQISVGRDGSRGLLRHRSHAVERVRHCPITHPLIEAAGAWRGDGPPAHRVPHQPRPRVSFAASCTTGAVVVDDEGTLVHQALGHDFQVTGSGFWQVHPDAPELLAGAVLAALSPNPGERALDLYAGAGLFSYALASRGVAVTAVEELAVAAADARVNCDALDVTVLACDVAVGLPAIDGPVDLVVLDPPRTGASPAIMQQIARLRPRAIAYVSCDGATLARDLRAAAEAGYRLAHVRAFDLFPMTAHLECLALLVPAESAGM